MNFGKAIDILNSQGRVARKGWNGKGMYLYLVGAGRYPPSTPAGEAIAAEHKDGLVPYLPYIAMKTATEEVVPWLASQTDILADDWELFFTKAMMEPAEEAPYPQTKNWLDDPEEVKASLPAPTPTEADVAAISIGPRVTPDAIEDFIKSEHYFTASDGVIGSAFSEIADDTDVFEIPDQLKLLTICVLVLKNGFTVEGVSACADPKNFNAEIGRGFARRAARDKIGAFLGFELRTKLAMVEQVPEKTKALGMVTYFGSKVVQGEPKNLGDYNRLRGWEMPADEDPATPGYLVHYPDGGKSNVPGYPGYVSWSPKDVFERSYEPMGGVE